MVISTIAIIVNRDQISTYILQVIGNHLTSTGLSKAKHIFDPGPTRDSRIIYAASVSNQLLQHNALNIKDASDICKNIGGL